MRRRLGYNVAQYTIPQPTSPQFLADLDRAVTLGAWGIRLDIVPCYTANGTDLHEVAAKITAARAHGLAIHAMLPHWRTADKIQHKDTASIDALAQFALNVGRALGTEISSWELGNEPDIPTFAPDGADPEYQAAVSTAMVANLPAHAHICSPGLAPASDTFDPTGKPLSMAPATFAARYWAALDVHTKSRITGNGIHLYGTADIAQPWSTYHQLPAIVAAGEGRPLEVTELNGDPKASPATRAVQLHDALVWLSTTALPIDRCWVYEMSTQNTELPYGAYDQHGIPTPTLPVLQAWKARP